MTRHVTDDALGRLRAASARMGSTALVVLDDGELVIGAGALTRRIELMSVTKSIVSLVVGQLVDRKLLALEQPVADFVTAWKGTPKEAIRIAHLLEHTSGLADRRTTEEIYAAGDFVAFAIAAELEHPPGQRFFYSNRASNLLAPIVERASGKRLDVWAGEHLFAPLGIRDFAWDTDRAGNVQVMAGLQMTATGLARIGQLVLDRGRIGGEQVVSEAWIDASTATYCSTGTSPRGLLWWLDPASAEIGLSRDLFDRWRASGVPEAFIAKLIHLEGQYFAVGRPGRDRPFLAAVQKALIGRERRLSDRLLEPYYAMTWKAGRPDGDLRYGEPRSIAADGWGGQLLMIVPSRRLVVARLREVSGWSDAEEEPTFLSVVNEQLLGVEPRRTALLFRAARPVFRWVRRLQRSRRG